MLIFIMGKSGSGKNYIYHHIMNSELRSIICPWITYTTRPKRKNEIDRIDMHFCTEEDILELENNDEIIEKRSFNKADGLYYYATKVINPKMVDHNIYLLPEVTPDSYKKIIEYYRKFKECNLKTLGIILEAPHYTLQKRLLINRGDDPIEEITRRLAYDDKLYENFYTELLSRDETEKKNNPIVYCLNTRPQDPDIIKNMISEYIRTERVSLPDFYYKN